MANPFYVQPGNDFGQGIQGLTQGIDRFGQVQREKEAVAQQQKGKEALAEAFKSGDPNKIRETMIQYPEMQKAATAAFGFTNDRTREIVADTYRRALSDPTRAAEYMDAGIQEVAAAGGSPLNMVKDYAMLKTAPEQALKSMRAGYAALATDQEYELMFGAKAGQNDARTMFLTSLGLEPGTPEYRAAAEQFYVKKGKAGDSAGPFAGTGIENQMLNIALDPNIPEDDPRKIVARQRLGRDTTTVTPEGTFIRPGYDLSEVGQQQPAAAGKPESFVNKPPTESQAKASGFHDRMISAQKELDTLADYDPTSTIEAARGASNVTASAEKQRYNQAASDWIRSKLRKESGAVIGDDEMAAEYRTYFPIYGDSQEVIEQKARARKTAEEAMLRDADPEYKKSFKPAGGRVKWGDL